MLGPMTRTLSVHIDRFPIVGAFAIARGAKTEAVVCVATLRDGAHVGRGECVPYARYGETVESVMEQIASARAAIEAGAGRDALSGLLPAGAARNALDCAVWDLEAKQSGRGVAALAGVGALAPVVTAYTLSLGTPAAMATAARAAADRPVLKIKLGGEGDLARLAAVRAAAPHAELIVDANESWTPADLPAYFAACAAAGVTLIEQPLPADADGALAEGARPVPVCADESVHDRRGLAALRDRYDVVNIKLDKTGGLTEALALADAAEALGFGLFVGCMVGTSLAMAPALLLAGRARFVDLDGPLLLQRDRAPGLRYEGSLVFPPPPALWG